MTMMSPALAPRVIYALAGAADVAPVTVRRRLQGLPLKPSTLARLEAAATRLSVVLPSFAPAAPSAPATTPAPSERG
jgi:hypothetical protein